MPTNTSISYSTNFRFKAVLWDMDGTLIDSEPIWIEQERALMQSLGVHWSDEDAIHCIGGPMERVDAFMRSKLSPEKLNRYAPLELTNTLLQQMSVRLGEGVSFTPGAQSLLHELHQSRVPQALVSASSRPLVDAALRSIGAEFFAITVSDNDVSQSKPHPEGYLKAAEHIGVAIDECLVIEDSRTGVTAAIEDGAYVLGLPHFAQLPTGQRVLHRHSLDGLSLADLHDLFESIHRR